MMPLKFLDNIYQDYWKKFEQHLIENYQNLSVFFIAAFVIAIILIYLIFGQILKVPPFIDCANYYFNNFGGRKLLYPLFFVLIYLLTTLILFQKLKYPKNPKNKIGVFMAISNRFADDKETRLFIKKIHMETEKVLNTLGFDTQFNVMYLDEFKSRKIIRYGKQFYDRALNKSKWVPNLNASRWSFLLFGDLKKGEIGGKSYYKFEPNYAVTHKFIPLHASNSLGQDFNEILISQKWQFPISEDLRALDIIATNLKENILYALGVAAFVSGNINIAIQLHQKLYDSISSQTTQPGHVIKLYSKTKKMLADENFYLGIFFYKKGEIDKAIDYQEKTIFFKPNFYYAHINLAEHYYRKGSSHLPQVEKYIGLAEKYSHDSTYKLSRGFIQMDVYKKYKEGTEIYLQALKSHTIPKNVLENTKTFLEGEKLKNSKPFLDFLIGLIYYFGINQKEKALETFKQFIAKNNKNTEIAYLLEKAKKYINT